MIIVPYTGDLELCKIPNGKLNVGKDSLDSIQQHAHEISKGKKTWKEYIEDFRKNSKTLQLKKDGAPENNVPLAPEYDYLQGQVEECRSYLQKQLCIIEKPQDSLSLGPLPDGKNCTLVLSMESIMFYTPALGSSTKGRAMRPTRNPDGKVRVAMTKVDKELKAKVVGVWCRPGLYKFLANVSKHYEIVVFSSMPKQCVEKIIKRLDPEKKYISHVFSNENVSQARCFKSRRYVFESHDKYAKNVEDLHDLFWAYDGDFILKDIEGLFIGDHPRRAGKVVCVDDDISFYLGNLRNLVPIRPYVGDARDTELSELGRFLQSLAEAEDVREKIMDRCNLHAHVHMGLNRPSDCMTFKKEFPAAALPRDVEAHVPCKQPSTQAFRYGRPKHSPQEAAAPADPKLQDVSKKVHAPTETVTFTVVTYLDIRSGTERRYLQRPTWYTTFLQPKFVTDLFEYAGVVAGTFVGVGGSLPQLMTNGEGECLLVIAESYV